MAIDSLIQLERDNTPEERLRNKVAILANSAWKDKWGNESDTLTPWLNNFKADERLQALFLLSHFVYFDAGCVRELLIRAYEDYVRRPIITQIRRGNGDTMNEAIIESEYKKRLQHVRFLCLGNPSESSAMMLYFFRQENNIPLNLFISVDRLFEHKEENEQRVAILKADDINQIFVLDDFCATGSQAKEFSKKYVAYINRVSPQIEVNYIALVGTFTGKAKLETLSYNKKDFCISLDDTYRVFNSQARFFRHVQDFNCSKPSILSMCLSYGRRLCPQNPKGYKNGQLMIGFFHNTPNNTIPIFWSTNYRWFSIFKRYNKIYNV